MANGDRLGIFVDDDGSVWGASTSAASMAHRAQVSRLGGPASDAHSAHAFEQALDSVFERYPEAQVSSRVVDYETLKLPESSQGSWVPATVALALYDVVRSMTVRDHTRILALRQSLRGLEASLVEYDDEVFEVCATCFAPYEFDTTLEDQIRALVNAVCRDAGYAPRHYLGWNLNLVASADDQTLPQVAALAWASQSEQRRDAIRLVVASHAAVAIGAACLKATRTGELPSILPLCTLWFGVGVSSGGKGTGLIYRNTTVPTAMTQQVEIAPNAELLVELYSPTEGERCHSFAVPSRLLGESSRAAAARPYEITIEVDHRYHIRLTFSSAADTHSIMLSQLIREAARQAQPAEAQPTGAQPALQAARTAPLSIPTHLMRIIEALDEVDLGVRALSDDDLATPAGTTILTLQARLLDTLQDLGVTYYPAFHETFDPTIHEAMAAEHIAGLPPNTIIDELRRGFSYEGRIIRYSLVRVANPR